MTSPHTLVSSRNVPDGPDTRLAGPWLPRVRLAWGLLAAVLVGLYAVQVPPYWAQLQTICTGAGCAIIQPSTASADALRAVGLTVAGYAGLSLAITLLSSLVGFAVATVIVWRKSHDWMALLVAAVAVALGTVVVSATLQEGNSPWHLTALVATGLSNLLLFLLAARFPNGRTVPRWARWLPIVWMAAWATTLGAELLTGTLWWNFYLTAWLLVMAGSGVVQVYRYRAMSTPRERAQTRWVVLGGSSALVAILAVTAPLLLVPALRRPGSLLPLLSTPASAVAISLCVLSVGVAILRSRLYDIDVIIRRTLIYGVLTGTLAVVYGASILGAQLVVQAIWGRQALPPVFIVASTLLIAALFRPLRGQVQRLIDRRFFRRKYDAAQTLAAFGATLRTEYDVDELQRQLLAAVTEATQPSQVSLWLRWPAPDTPQRG